MQDNRKNKLWAKSRQLLLAIYKTTELFPNNGSNKLKQEMRKTCVAIPANITRGVGGYKQTDLERFLKISIKSAIKLENQLKRAQELHFLNRSDYKKLSSQNEKVINMMGSILGT